MQPVRQGDPDEIQGGGLSEVHVVLYSTSVQFISFGISSVPGIKVTAASPRRTSPAPRGARPWRRSASASGTSATEGGGGPLQIENIFLLLSLSFVFLPR